MIEKITETNSKYTHLEKMSVLELLVNINKEDQTVPYAVEKAIPKIEALVKAALKQIQKGGRLFYIGAGTSGRLGILDASECPPTFGVKQGLVIGLIAGGDKAIRKAVEFAEDDSEQGWKDLLHYNISTKDFVIGLTASGTTPYVLGAIRNCNKNKIKTGCITCNSATPIAKISKYPIVVIAGPEFVTGSTRMKSGTAQKMILNMISTSIMIRLGKILGNRMVDMQLSNNKLIDRGTKMLVETLDISEKKANQILKKYGSVRKALQKKK